MTLLRSIIPVVLISLLTGAAFLFLGSSAGYEDSKSGYAVLKTDASVDDNFIYSSLMSSGNFQSEVISESSQWVLLDVFDSLEKVPLGSYSSRVMDFDPRYDSYADELKKIFVKDDKRFFYIPLRAGGSDSVLLDNQLTEILDNIPFTVDYYGVTRPLLFYFIIFAAASFCLLFICFFTYKKHPGIINVITLIPPLCSLSFFGASGIACAAVIFAFFIFMKDPVIELVSSIGSSSKVKSKKSKSIYKDYILPYRFHWLFLPVFAASIAVIVYFSQINLIFLLAVFAVSLGVFCFSVKLLSLSGKEHKRFTPVMIIRSPSLEFIFPVYILPFAAGVLAAVLFTPIIPSSYNSNEKFENIISEEDYFSHISRQAAFSVSQIGSSSDLFPAFYFDTDGLPSMRNQRTSQIINHDDYPPFPLRTLMDFFESVNNGSRTNTGPGSSGVMEKMSLLVLVIFLVPLIFIRKKDGNSRKTNYNGIKKIYGKTRMAGINLNKKLVYNNKNQMRKYKDA